MDGKWPGFGGRPWPFRRPVSGGKLYGTRMISGSVSNVLSRSSCRKLPLPCKVSEHARLRWEYTGLLRIIILYAANPVRKTPVIEKKTNSCAVCRMSVFNSPVFGSKIHSKYQKNLTQTRDLPTNRQHHVVEVPFEWAFICFHQPNSIISSYLPFST